MCRRRSRDYPAGVTDANKCRPVLDVVEDLPAHGWTDIGMGESATWVRHRPAKWKDEQSHAVVRGTAERQGELMPRHAVILANRDDLPLAEVVRRHRARQGPALTGRFGNAFKGPLVDMDLHHPPCRGYRANQAFHAYGRMARMLLRAVQCRLLPKAARRHGIRPLVRHMVRTVARLVTSGRRRSLLFASCCMRRDWLFHASLQLEGGWTPPPPPTAFLRCRFDAAAGMPDRLRRTDALVDCMSEQCRRPTPAFASPSGGRADARPRSEVACPHPRNPGAGLNRESG